MFLPSPYFGLYIYRFVLSQYAFVIPIFWIIYLPFWLEQVCFCHPMFLDINRQPRHSINFSFYCRRLVQCPISYTLYSCFGFSKSAIGTSVRCGLICMNNIDLWWIDFFMSLIQLFYVGCLTYDGQNISQATLTFALNVVVYAVILINKYNFIFITANFT